MMVASALKAFVPLATALASAALAWVLVEGGTTQRAVAVAGAVAVALLCAVAFELGERSLPEHPVRAVRLMELTRISQWVGAVVGAALVVWLAIVVAGKDLEGADKELLATIAAGLTTFVTTAFEPWSDAEADSTLGERIRDAFWRHYIRTGTDAGAGSDVHSFDASSTGERLVYSTSVAGVTGWSRAARRKRAEEIADLLKTP